MATHNAFWNQLLMRSDSIMDINANADDAVEQVLAQLSTVAEQFDRTFDPADQFEEYVAVAFCQALQRALTPKVAAPMCKVSVQNKTAPATTKAKPPQPAVTTTKAKAAKNMASKKPPTSKNNATSSKKTSGGRKRPGSVG